MTYFPQEQLKQIRESVNIVDVISNYGIKLTKKGNNYVGFCPFHTDVNHPAFTVSPEKQIYKCFTCEKTGNVFDFLMEEKIYGMTFPEAVKTIADMGNIKIDINIPTKKKVNENLYKIYEDANKIYQNNINNAYGAKAKEYLLNRGIDDEIIKEFGIGLSIDARDIILKSLSKKYDLKELVEAKIVSKNEYGTVDMYHSRIMFPLWNLDGKIVGYSGRKYLDLNSDEAKYINTSDSPIFKKGELLYNYHRSREECRSKDTVIVMEGFMDVIAAYQVGVTNTVAMMGTAVTRKQANLVRRMASKIILLFDGDAAGAKATMRSIDEFLELGVTPEVVRLEENLDPDEYIKKYGKDKFIDKLNHPINIMEFKLNYIKQDKNLEDDVEKANYVKEAIDILKNIDNDYLIELTIDRLVSETNLSKEFIKSKLEDKPIKKEIKEEKVEVKIKENKSKYEEAEASLLHYMLENVEAIMVYNDYVTNIRTEKYRFLARRILQFYKEHGTIFLADFLDTLVDDKEVIKVVGEVSSLKLKEDVTKKDLLEYVKVIQDGNYLDAIEELEDQMKKAASIEEKAKLGEEIRKLRVRRMKDVE